MRRRSFLSSVLATAGCAALGQRPTGPRQRRLGLSPQWRDGRFENPEPLKNELWKAATHALDQSPYRAPEIALPVLAVDPRRLAAPPASGLRVTWLGHSTTLVEIDGHRVLTDPMWSERASPLGGAGPARWYPPLIELGDLPPLDAVVISHDHYDHLDHGTIRALRGRATTFVVPLGVGAHLEAWGVPGERVVELDWWETTTVGDLEIACTPARHASGRTQVFDRNATLWCGFALLGPTHRVYFSGDTGLFRAGRDIGERLGPFDLTMIEVGAYGRYWPDWHIGPEQAVRLHGMVRGRLLLPIHWGLFTLSYHGWTEPVERALVAAARADVTLLTPRPGEIFEPLLAPPRERWWPFVPWNTAEDDPIVSSAVD